MEILRRRPSAGKSRKLGARATIATVAGGMVVVAALLVMAGPVKAQGAGSPDTRELLERVDRLQRDLTTLQRQVYRGGGSGGSGGAPAAGSGAVPSTLAADMQVRLDDLESQIRTLTGRLEETNHAITQLERKLDVVTSDMQLRLEKLESGKPSAMSGRTQAQGIQGDAQGQPGGAQAGAGPPPATAVPSQPGVLGTLPVDRPAEGEATAAARQGKESAGTSGVTLPEGSAKEQYEYATSFLARSDWNGAEQALNQFLAAHPKHELAANAQYWLGETHYVRGDYNNAALAFAKGYQEFPEGQKGPDNLLKLGMSLANLKKKDSACATFDRFNRDFPNASQQLKSRVSTEANKLGCK